MRFVLALALLASASAFAPRSAIVRSRVAPKMSVFDDAYVARKLHRRGRLGPMLSLTFACRVRSRLILSRVNAWKKEYPSIYAAGWGPTTKAERWNGRHAMFGWIALLFTGYAKSHGLIPNPDTLLDTKEWGTLAYLYGGSITNERAIIIVGESFRMRGCCVCNVPVGLTPCALPSLAGHLHLLLFSICAAVAPLSGQDKLYLEKVTDRVGAVAAGSHRAWLTSPLCSLVPWLLLQGEEAEPAAGLFVKASPGLTPGAELQNGRLAMLGLTALIVQSVATQTPILDVISTGLGHTLF